MTTARIVKLAAGDAISFLVEGTAFVDGNFGKQIRLDGQTAEDEAITIFVGADSATRQLERIGATPESIKGSIIKVEKVAKDGKTFINISRAGAAVKTAVKPPADQTPDWLRDQSADEEQFVATTVDPLAKIFAHYDKCFAHACELARRTKNPETVVTLEGISAVAATIFIATKSGV